MKRTSILVTSGLVMIMMTGQIKAQVPGGDTRFGAQLGLGENVDLGIGARVGFSLEGIVDELQGTVTLNYFFPGKNQQYWGMNFNALYPLKLESNAIISPYVGAGVGISRYSIEYDSPVIEDYGETKLNLNLLAGTLIGNRETKIPFVELRIPFGSFDDVGFFVTVGVWF